MYGKNRYKSRCSFARVNALTMVSAYRVVCRWGSGWSLVIISREFAHDGVSGVQTQDEVPLILHHKTRCGTMELVSQQY